MEKAARVGAKAIDEALCLHSHGDDWWAMGLCFECFYGAIAEAIARHAPRVEEMGGALRDLLDAWDDDTEPDIDAARKALKLYDEWEKGMRFEMGVLDGSEPKGV